MFMNISKVRVTLPLLHLSFEESPIAVDPIVFGHCLVLEALRDVLSSLQSDLDFEMFADEIPDSLILINVEWCASIVVEHRKVHRVLLCAIFDSLVVENRRLILRCVDQIVPGNEEDENGADLVPAIRETPPECLTFIVGVFERHSALFFKFLIELFDVEVDLVSELVKRNHCHFFLIQAVWIHFDDDAGDFSAIRFHFELNIRLVVDLLFANLTANRVCLGDDWHDLLKLSIDLSQLLLSLLLVQLVAHLLLELFFGFLALIFQLLLFLTHLSVELLTLLLHLLLCFLAIKTLTE
mmetsp:Transcript_33777/g.41747  ORF Transcript_33777/g.41747 Transcript_33777/m.41747 type:complete len:296 (-) Transcript_33777:1929-2816(-)